MNEDVYKMLSELNTKASSVRVAFEDLFDPGLDTVPIPFFGDILGAQVITVGVNPSDGEIREGGWPRPVDTPTLYKRLIQYFSNEQFPSHPWFKPWEQALGYLDVSYTNGTAAHVDLCPWPTKPMSKLNRHRFTTLVSQSLPWFWRCIRCMLLATNLRLILMAGTVTKGYYLDRFLAKEGNDGDTALIGKVSRGGIAFVRCYRLRVANKEFPVFYCSVSPSARTSAKLPDRVYEHRDHLMTFLS